MFLALLIFITILLTAVLIITTPDQYFSVEESLKPKGKETPTREAPSPKKVDTKLTAVELRFGPEVSEELMALAVEAMEEAIRRAEEDTRREEEIDKDMHELLGKDDG